MIGPSPTTEFIYLTLKPSVKPEDPSSIEGKKFLDAISVVWKESGYIRSYWGRTVEKEENVVWVVEWRDPTTTAALDSLIPLLESGTQPISFRVTLTPPLVTDRDALAISPVTEIIVLPFQHTISPEDKAALETDLINFRNALFNIQSGKPPLSISTGWVERPGPIPHDKSPSGQALLTVSAVGWESKEVHDKVLETKEFKQAIAPVNERTLPEIDGLGLRHVRFKRDEKAKGE